MSNSLQVRFVFKLRYLQIRLTANCIGMQNLRLNFSIYGGWLLKIISLLKKK